MSGYRGIIRVRRKSDMDCVWLLSVPVGSQIRVSQHFSSASSLQRVRIAARIARNAERCTIS